MRHRNRRLATIALSALVLAAAVALGLFALRDSVVFFYSPSEIAAAPPEAGERVRVGGLVLEESIDTTGTTDGAAFAITDRVETVRVVYAGILPDLFREGQGVIAEGRFRGDGVFQAETVLAKHDETYMPPEVAEALREAGVWQGDEAAGPADQADVTAPSQQ
ncbi:cytochrome c maturation protein CcmE [Maricaulis salignorans]|uniref:Cytochrome c-type biogenesis protein CcmE n=1 Tax=Maricaulis salignorans TaxID=144026 RepID=A0A1G9Q0Z9_9PROT|nr:cytochrome c maturation protein CcmE [Maricaulis salignorans]SDM04742.1 cytochrome c-type biogenesis protein CcmE [Maricaulis salignorans]